MKLIPFATLILSVMVSAKLFAEPPMPMPSEAVPTPMPNTQTIQGKNASGQDQTTIIDASGNLKMIDKKNVPAKPSPSPQIGLPPGSANIPPANPPITPLPPTPESGGTPTAPYRPSSDQDLQSHQQILSPEIPAERQGSPVKGQPPVQRMPQ